MAANTKSEDSQLKKEDLFLLLESYEQQIDSNKTLLEQQSKLIEQHNLILTKQNTIRDSVGQLIEKLTGSHSDITNLYKDGTLQCFKEHSGIAVRIYLIYIGIGAVVITLMGLLYKAFDKFEILDSIAKHLGV